jgi:hypothetical protein
MDIAGKWGNSEISVDKEKQVKISMGSRPNGNGVVLCEKPDVILVDFPDDRMYVGTLIKNEQIQWSALGTLQTNNVWNR